MGIKFPFLSGETIDGYLPVNMYFSPQEINGHNALIGRPGLKTFIDSGLYAEGRAIYGADNSCYVLIGNTLFRIFENKTKQTIGTIDSVSGPAWIEGNGSQIQVVAGESAYIYENGSLTKLTSDKMSFIPGSLCYEGGYFLYSALGTNNFYESEVNDGSDVNEVDYAIVTGKPDLLAACLVNNGEVWAMCQNSYEVYYNSGGSTFGFSKSFQGYIEEGLSGPKAATAIAGSLFWLSDKKSALGSQQYTANKISSPIVDSQLKSADLSNAIAFGFHFNGHTFVAFTVPALDKTFVYDASTKLWYQWGSYPNNGRWRPNCYAYCWGKHLALDYENGIIYEMDSDIHTDNDQLFLWERTVPLQINSDVPFTVDYIRLEFEQGVGISTGQGSDPQAMLRFSDDKGKTWSNEIWSGLGAIGERHNITEWQRLGRGNYFTAKVSITDPVKRVCIGAFAGIS